jgi:hypothetical protein
MTVRAHVEAKDRIAGKDEGAVFLIWAVFFEGARTVVRVTDTYDEAVRQCKVASERREAGREEMSAAEVLGIKSMYIERLLLTLDPRARTVYTTLPEGFVCDIKPIDDPRKQTD